MVDGIKFNGGNFQAKANFFENAENKEKYKNILDHLTKNEAYLGNEGSKATHTGNGNIDNIEITNFVSHIDKGADGGKGDGVITDDEIMAWAKANGQEFHESLVKTGFDELKNFLYAIAGNNVATSEVDTNGDGIKDKLTTITDSKGNLIYEAWNDKAEGANEHVTTFNYDDNGNFLGKTHQERLTKAADGSDYGIGTTKYNANNKKTEQFVYLDENGDGKQDKTISRFFNEKEQLSTTATKSYDANGKLAWSESASYFYYSNGTSTSNNEYDNNGDGKMDSAAQVFYDKQGKETQRNVDSNLNGNYDTSTTYKYEADGSSTHYSRFDANDDGIYDKASLSKYNSKLDLIEILEDEDLNGFADKKATYSDIENGTVSMMKYI